MGLNTFVNALVYPKSIPEAHLFSQNLGKITGEKGDGRKKFSLL
jgi:hypothetical protein